ncbi:MAG TPA: hypothetical protein VNE21_04000, partial [Mycobacteriales bacterium]|nr:hypothetical protein [Mycobacteriales bacterium]
MRRPRGRLTRRCGLAGLLVGLSACATAAPTVQSLAPHASLRPSPTMTLRPTARASPVVRRAAPVRRSPPLAPPFALGTRVVTVLDPTRGTPARGPTPAHSGRVLTTTVWYPVRGPASAGVVSDATPLAGAFPLIAFAHGFDVTPARYASLTEQLAGAGYVVAAPLFPISGAGLPGPPSEDDMANQPGDLSAVITAMLRAATPGGWLAGAVDPRRIALVGHSDGAETVAAMMVVPADRDPRVGAAVILAGQLPTWGGEPEPERIPILLEQGRDDTINPPYLSQDLFAALHPPKSYLDVFTGTHIEPVVGTSVDAVAVRASVVAFLDLTFHPTRSALRDLLRWADDPGV